jgi:hypothetical protein
MHQCQRQGGEQELPEGRIAVVAAMLYLETAMEERAGAAAYESMRKKGGMMRAMRASRIDWTFCTLMGPLQRLGWHTDLAAGCQVGALQHHSGCAA